MPSSKVLFTTVFFILVSACVSTQEKQASDNNNSRNINSHNYKNYKKALGLLNNGKPDEASKLLKEITTQNPNMAGPWANLGLIYYQKSKLKEAESAIEKAIKVNPKFSKAYNLLGMTNLKQGKIREAEKAYLHALKYESDYSNAHYNIALLYDIYLQNIPKAVSHYETYLTLTGNKDKTTQDWINELKKSLKN